MTGGAEDGGPVQVFVDLTRFAATVTRAQLRDRVRELEDVARWTMASWCAGRDRRAGVLSVGRSAVGTPVR